MINFQSSSVFTQKPAKVQNPQNQTNKKPQKSNTTKCLYKLSAEIWWSDWLLTGLQTGCLVERRQKEVWGGWVEEVFFGGWGRGGVGGSSICPALLTACLRSPSSRPQASFFLSKKAEYFLGAQSGWVLVKPACAWAICCRGKSIKICVCVCVSWV